MFAEVVKALKHRKPSERRRNADSRKTRVSRRRIRTTVIHRRNNGNARWHFVVEQPPHFRSQNRREFVIQSVVRTVLSTINAARQIALKRFHDRFGLRDIVDDHGEAFIPECLLLECFRLSQELISAHLQQRVLVTVTRSASTFTSDE